MEDSLVELGRQVEKSSRHCVSLFAGNRDLAGIGSRSTSLSPLEPPPRLGMSRQLAPAGAGPSTSNGTAQDAPNVPITEEEVREDARLREIQS